MIHTPLQLRWKRAKAIVAQGLPLGYQVSVRMSEDGMLTGCTCTCPDHEKMVALYTLAMILAWLGLDYSIEGIPLWRGNVACKHAMALALCVRTFLYM